MIRETDQQPMSAAIYGVSAHSPARLDSNRMLTLKI